MIATNRVGDDALSATGTGSCPEDEGFFHDAVSAPAAHIGFTLLYERRYSVGRKVGCFASLPNGICQTPLRYAWGIFVCMVLLTFALKKRRLFLCL